MLAHLSGWIRRRVELPAMPFSMVPFERRSGMLVEPSAKHGSQMSSPPNANWLSPLSASRSGEPNEPGSAMPPEGRPTYPVVQPLAPRTAT